MFLGMLGTPGKVNDSFPKLTLIPTGRLNSTLIITYQHAFVHGWVPPNEISVACRCVSVCLWFGRECVLLRRELIFNELT